MKVNQMRFFAEVCAKGSITMAAETLHVTQPAISKAIRELEREHGVTLFRRTKNGLELTRDGSFILLDIKEILDKIDLLSEKMSYMGRNKHIIHMGMPPMIAIATFDYIKKYKEMYPYIQFDFFHEASPNLRRIISNGGLDLCLATGDNTGLYHCETTKLTSYEVCVCVAPSHPLAAEKSLSWHKIVGQRLVLYKDRYQIGQSINQQLNKYRLPDTEIFQSNNTSMHFNLITNHGYCGFMYRDMAEKQSGIVCIPLEEPIFVNVDLVCQTNSEQNKDIYRFIKYIQSIYRED